MSFSHISKDTVNICLDNFLRRFHTSESVVGDNIALQNLAVSYLSSRLCNRQDFSLSENLLTFLLLSFSQKWELPRVTHHALYKDGRREDTSWISYSFLTVCFSFSCAFPGALAFAGNLLMMESVVMCFKPMLKIQGKVDASQYSLSLYTREEWLSHRQQQT